MSCTLSAASLAFEEKRKRTAPNSIVRFIVAPLGSFGDDWRAHQQVIDQLVRYPNVFSDTSGVRRFDYVVQRQASGAAQTIVWLRRPLASPRPRIAQDQIAWSPARQQALITGGNARRLLRREACGPTAGLALSA